MEFLGHYLGNKNIKQIIILNNHWEKCATTTQQVHPDGHHGMGKSLSLSTVSHYNVHMIDL